MSAESHAFGPGWRPLGGVGLALLLLALLIEWDARRLPEPGAVGVGPAVAMHLVAALVAVLGVAHLVVAWGARVRATEEGFVPRDAAPAANRAALAWVLGGLAALGLSVPLEAGFVLGASALFVATARAFGQPLGWRSLSIGLGLTTLVFLFFARVLSLTLPVGPFERLLLG